MKLWEERQEEEVSQVREDSIQEERLRSKLFYKIFLLSIKYFPIVSIICEILYSIFAYFKLDGSYFTFIGGFCITTIILLYLASYVFRYCYLYRLSLHSIVLTNLLALYDTIFGIPLDDLNMLRVYLVILLIGVISFIKFKVNDARHNRDFAR